MKKYLLSTYRASHHSKLLNSGDTAMNKIDNVYDCRGVNKFLCICLFRDVER